ncbi:hypothetical protein [Hoylesella pleuritidis]|jgi:hypothetical protein|uniref:Uncharacterized protein n=1 Tax=Hoylesella pleuritidis F0068 TaxID=1081904 RepID=U2MRQ0_9BACT|nr:hypothetical protein [Hoylesella pleuritidis]ERK04330.1 hypothetical protein HMPREF1218_2024 [Hoylesella pleuritidis F0068]
MKKIDHLPINWVNGLKLNNSHFFETYYNMVDTVRLDCEERLTGYNYGFGEGLTGTAVPVEIETKGDTVDTFSVLLKSCNAVTRNGFHIIYDRSLYGDYIPAAKLRDVEVDFSKRQELFIILFVNPYKLLPVGVPDPEITPLHHPYVLPEINIQLVPEAQVNKTFLERNCIIAGRGVAEGNLFTVDTQYIPPVQKTCYAQTLLSFLDFFTKHVKAVYDYSQLVYRKNITDSRRDTLVENTFSLCNVIQTFYSKNIFDLENLAAEQPPIHMVHLANRLANMLLTVLRTMPEKEFEVLLQYYNEWINVKPADFMHTIGDVASVVYKHTDIAPILSKIGDFIDILNKLFKKMSELEYVGLMRENIVISEDSERNVSESERKSWKVWE